MTCRWPKPLPDDKCEATVGLDPRATSRVCSGAASQQRRSSGSLATSKLLCARSTRRRWRQRGSACAARRRPDDPQGTMTFAATSAAPGRQSLAGTRRAGIVSHDDHDNPDSQLRSRPHPHPRSRQGRTRAPAQHRAAYPRWPAPQGDHRRDPWPVPDGRPHCCSGEPQPVTSAALRCTRAVRVLHRKETMRAGEHGRRGIFFCPAAAYRESMSARC